MIKQMSYSLLAHRHILTYKYIKYQQIVLEKDARIAFYLKA